MNSNALSGNDNMGERSQTLAHALIFTPQPLQQRLKTCKILPHRKESRTVFLIVTSTLGISVRVHDLVTALDKKQENDHNFTILIKLLKVFKVT